MFDSYFKYKNAVFYKILSFSQQELFAEPIINFVYPKDRDATLIELKN